MKHYTKEELEQYRNGGMSIFGKMKCAAHLKECESCATLLAELDEDADFVGKLRESLKRYEEAVNEEAAYEETAHEEAAHEEALLN
jgi:hypothetical protein